MTKPNLACPEYPQNGLEATPRVAIIEMVSLGLIDEVKRMLEKGYDANEQTDLGHAAVLEAINREDLEMLKLLVEHGARLDISNIWGDTPIKWAEELHQKEIVEYIKQELAKKEEENHYTPRPSMR